VALVGDVLGPYPLREAGQVGERRLSFLFGGSVGRVLAWALFIDNHWMNAIIPSPEVAAFTCDPVKVACCGNTHADQDDVRGTGLSVQIVQDASSG